jgi:hypothetical protein
LEVEAEALLDLRLAPDRRGPGRAREHVEDAALGVAIAEGRLLEVDPPDLAGGVDAREELGVAGEVVEALLPLGLAGEQLRLHPLEGAVGQRRVDLPELLRDLGQRRGGAVRRGQARALGLLRGGLAAAGRESDGERERRAPRCDATHDASTFAAITMRWISLVPS